MDSKFKNQATGENVNEENLKPQFSFPPFLSNSDGARYIRDQIKNQPSFQQHWLQKQNGGINTTESTPSVFTDTTETPAKTQNNQNNQKPEIPSQFFLFPPNDIETSLQDISGQNGKIKKTASFSNFPSDADLKDDMTLYQIMSENPRRSRRKSVTSFSNLTEDSRGSLVDKRVIGRRRTIETTSNKQIKKTKEAEMRRKKSSSPSNYTSSDFSQSTEQTPDQQRWKNKAHSQPYIINHKMLQRRLRVGYLSHEFVRSLHKRGRSGSRYPHVERIRPIDRFRKIASIIRLLLRCLDRKISLVSQRSQMSFALLSREMTVTRKYEEGLYFDCSEYKATTEAILNEKVQNILTIVPYRRTEKQVQYALQRLRATVEEFAEFPLRMQEALVKVAWLDKFEPKRVIIRQGHKAETFYFIVSGTALVTKNRLNSSGDGFVETVQILKRGKSFGELAIVRHEQRTNNVVSQTDLTLLTVGRDEFIDIFMHRMDGEEPEFITFLRKLPEFQGFPLYKLPRRKPQTCAFTYFRVGVVICADSSKSDMIVIVKSGFCRVVKKLTATKPNLPELQKAWEKLNCNKVGLDQNKSLKSSSFRNSSYNIEMSHTSNVFDKRRKSSFSTPSVNRAKTCYSMVRRSCDEKNIIRPDRHREDHRNTIILRHMRWQADHPISRDTFSLLMTGRDVEEGGEEDGFKDLESYRRGSSFDQASNTFASSDRRDSTQSSFRSQILRRSRNSLVNAWFPKKVSMTGVKLPTLNETLSARQEKSNDQPKTDQVCVHIQTLGERDVFGLLPILFNESEGATPVSLISEGAECILISKDFFLKHFDDELRERLVRMVQPYPTEEKLQSNMQEQSNWDAYKFLTVHNHVTAQKLRLSPTR